MIRRCLTLLLPAALFAASPIADSARRRDLEGVRAALAAKADVNAPLADGTTALHWAVRADDVPMVQMLLRHGSKPDAANRYGVRPLALACENGSSAAVELLLQAGANPSEPLPSGETPLMACARTGNPRTVQMLLEQGAAVDAKEPSRQQTALMWAAAEGHSAVVEVLLQAGADPAWRLKTGFNAFLLAVREGQTTVVRAMLKAGADINDAIRDTPARGSSSFRGPPRAGTTALHLAVENAHFELAAMLLDLGANPNAMEPGYTPLHMISNVRKPGVGDNDPAPRGSGNMTSLDLVRKFKERGASLNARMTRKVGFGLTSLNTEGATVFFLAAKTADAELMRLLASLGADPKIPNADGSTPLMAAAGLGTRSPGEDAGTESEAVEAVQVALELGNEIDAVDVNGETAMHGAAYKNLPAVVDLLAQKGAAPAIWSRPNKQGWTPLTIAEGYRFGNYKPSPVTVAALRRVMLAAGIQPVPYQKPGMTTNSEYRKTN